MFRIDLLPAQRGDCIWIAYGEGADLHHVLIDGGPAETIDTLVPELERRIRALPGKTNRVELLVVTHIDADHIQGIVSLLSDHARMKLFRDVWFNGWTHHANPNGDDAFLGGVDAERLTAPLLTGAARWNRAFEGNAIVVPDGQPLPTRKLRGGLTITLLGPTPDQLTTLAPNYRKECMKAGVTAGSGAPILQRGWMREEFLGGGFHPAELARAPATSDSSKPNAASITLIAEYAGARVLLLADAHAAPTARALDRLGPGPHHFDAVKISHHGSRNNTSKRLCDRIHSGKWLLSTNGANFGHPHGECLGRIIVSQTQPAFYLNYVTERVTDLIDGAGKLYSVKLPTRRSDGSFHEGISVKL